MLQKLRTRVSSNGSPNNNHQGFHNKDRLKYFIRLALFVAIVAMITASILQIILPIKPYKHDVFADGLVLSRNNSKPSESTSQVKMKHEVRSGLFKPSRRVRTNSVTDKTVERIFSSIKLKAIMPIGRQNVAYIVLKNGQMRKCKVGDTVKDMFTVIDIKSKSVTIDILGHKLNLTR